MHVKKPKTFNQLGDTIVEVMVVLAVLGLAISISYATANRSLLNTRQALENSQATELVRSQVEAIRSMACSTGNINCSANPALFTTGTSFCIDTTASSYNVIPTTNPSCSQGTVPYGISITYNNTPTDTFTVVATWPDVLGQGNDTVTYVYRLHQ
jgi:type II secretory pathway pseudopilin PulG